MLGFGALGELALGEGRLGALAITGILAATETKDVFLAGGQGWNLIASAEVGVIELNFTGAQIGVVRPTAIKAKISIQVS